MAEAEKRIADAPEKEAMEHARGRDAAGSRLRDAGHAGEGHIFEQIAWSMTWLDSSRVARFQAFRRSKVFFFEWTTLRMTEKGGMNLSWRQEETKSWGHDPRRWKSRAVIPVSMHDGRRNSGTLSTLNVNARRRVEGRDETLEKKRNSCTSNSVRNHGNSGLLPPLLMSRASSAEADWSIRDDMK
jgi:hypothetical protein